MAGICVSRILRACCALAVVGGLLPKLAVAGCALRTMALPVQVVDQRGIATVAIDGVDVPLMVNTGVFYSSLGPDAAERFQLHVTDAPTTLNVRGLTGRVHERIARVDKLINGQKLRVEFDTGAMSLIYVSSVSRRVFFTCSGGKVFGRLAEGPTKNAAAPASGASAQPVP